MHESDKRLLALAREVEKLHGAAELVGPLLVYERSGNVAVRAATVSEFKLLRHPTAKTCYAWLAPADGATGERFYTVLGTSEVDSAEKAYSSIARKGDA